MTRERQQERKVERLMATTHTVPQGPSILESITAELDRAIHRWLDIKETGYANPPNMSTSRGEVRGLARAVAILQNPYEPNVRAVEKEAASRVRRMRHAQARAE